MWIASYVIIVWYYFIIRIPMVCDCMLLSYEFMLLSEFSWVFTNIMKLYEFNINSMDFDEFKCRHMSLYEFIWMYMSLFKFILKSYENIMGWYE